MCSTYLLPTEKGGLNVLKPLRPLRMSCGSHVRNLLCYGICFAAPLLWQWMALKWIYPWKLAATAPDAAANLSNAVPALARLLKPMVKAASAGDTLQEVLISREVMWHRSLWLCLLAAWVISLLLQLLWRLTHREALLGTRALRRAIFSYRFTVLLATAVCAAAAWCVWAFGVQYVPGRTLWDYWVCFGAYPLIPLACILVSRLAASPVISGKHAFFKRL